MRFSLEGARPYKFDDIKVSPDTQVSEEAVEILVNHEMFVHLNSHHQVFDFVPQNKNIISASINAKLEHEHARVYTIVDEKYILRPGLHCTHPLCMSFARNALDIARLRNQQPSTHSKSYIRNS